MPHSYGASLAIDGRRGASNLEAEASDWERKAVLALEQNDEDLAREALRLKARALAEAARTRGRVSEQEQAARSMKEQLERIESKLDDLKARQKTLAAQVRQASTLCILDILQQRTSRCYRNRHILAAETGQVLRAELAAQQSHRAVVLEVPGRPARDADAVVADGGEAECLEEAVDRGACRFVVGNVVDLPRVCDWLASKGIIQKIAVPLRLTRKSTVEVEEPAYFYDAEPDL